MLSVPGSSRARFVIVKSGVVASSQVLSGGMLLAPGSSRSSGLSSVALSALSVAPSSNQPDVNNLLDQI